MRKMTEKAKKDGQSLKASLLALNAAFEAARAGEGGAEFRVAAERAKDFAGQRAEGKQKGGIAGSEKEEIPVSRNNDGKITG